MLPDSLHGFGGRHGTDGTEERSVIDHFSPLEDPRQAWKVVYLLPEILLLVLGATLAGADGGRKRCQVGKRCQELFPA